MENDRLFEIYGHASAMAGDHEVILLVYDPATGGLSLTSSLPLDTIQGVLTEWLEAVTEGRHEQVRVT